MTSIDRFLMTGLVIFPLIGAAGALIVGLPRRGRGQGRGLTRARLFGPALFGGLGTGAMTAAAAWLVVRVNQLGAFSSVIGGWSRETGIGLILDPWAAWILLVIGLVSTAIYLYAIGSGYGTVVFIPVFGIALSGLAAVVLAEDLFNLFVALEVVSLAAVILVAYQRSTRALYAAFRYLVISTVSIALYLVGLLVLYRETGELALSRIAAVLMENPVPGREGVIALAAAFIVTGLATRVALVPFHVWLPDAHGSAPHPVSAFLSGLVLKAGFFSLWRVVRMLPPGTGRLDLVLIIMGAVSALVGVVLALMQSDAKRLLAYHSISQMGLIVLGAGAAGLGAAVGSGVLVGSGAAIGAAGSSATVGSNAAIGAVFHAASHATFKSLLFLVVGVMVMRWKTHNLYQLREHNRVMRPARIEQLLYLIGAGAIAGVPGLSGFVGKTLIAGGIKDYNFLYMLVKVVSAGTVASFIKLGTVFFPGSAGKASVASGAGGLTRVESAGNVVLMRTGMGILAIITLLLGIGGGVRMSVFSAGSLVDSAMIISAGIAIFLLARTSRGRTVAHRIDSVRIGLDAALVCILAGTVALAVVV